MAQVYPTLELGELDGAEIDTVCSYADDDGIVGSTNPVESCVDSLGGVSDERTATVREMETWLEDLGTTDDEP